MNITIRYFEGCPNWRTARARLDEALRSKGSDPEVELEEVGTLEEAERLRFSGSPTILIDGVDPFPTDDAGYGLSCRVYRTEAGLEGSPSLRQLLDVLP